jgi:hypothetical protein
MDIDDQLEIERGALKFLSSTIAHVAKGHGFAAELAEGIRRGADCVPSHFETHLSHLEDDFTVALENRFDEVLLKLLADLAS